MSTKHCIFAGQTAAGSSNLQVSVHLSGGGGGGTLSAPTPNRNRDPVDITSQRATVPSGQNSVGPLSQGSLTSDEDSEAESSSSEDTALAAARQGDPSISGIDLQVDILYDPDAGKQGL